MKSIHILLLLLALLFMSACTSPPAAKVPTTNEPISQRWSGDYPIAELKRLPAAQQVSRVGYLGSAADFEVVWSAFKPGEALPTVDFSRQLVVFVRNVDFYNRTNIFKTELKDGVLEVLAMETMSAIPIDDKAAIAMAVVPRQGVKFIQAGTTRIPVSEK